MLIAVVGCLRLHLWAPRIEARARSVGWVGSSSSPPPTTWIEDLRPHVDAPLEYALFWFDSYCLAYYIQRVSSLKNMYDRTGTGV